MAKIISLINNTVLISEIEEVGSDIGQPDCKLINPFVINVLSDTVTLEPFMMDFTNQKSFMIHSDKIFTIADPSEKILEKYNKITKD